MMSNEDFNKSHNFTDMLNIAENDFDSEFWKLIDKMNWGEDNDYVRIRESLKNGEYGKFSDEDLRAIHLLFEKKKDNLKGAINSYLISIHGEDHRGYPNVATHFSDDGLDDAVSDIIGNGKESYSEYVSNPKKFMDEKYRGYESFSYAWHIPAIYG